MIFFFFSLAEIRTQISRLNLLARRRRLHIVIKWDGNIISRNLMLKHQNREAMELIFHGINALEFLRNDEG